MELRSRLEARLWFSQNRITISHWARENGLNPRVVYQVLEGRVDGTRGKSRQVAVALGIQPAPQRDQCLVQVAGFKKDVEESP